MSALFSKKFHEQQDIQEGQVPDDVSDQAVHTQPQNAQRSFEEKEPQQDEEQFIFETVPDQQFDNKYQTKDKQNYKVQDTFQSSQNTQKKDWRGERQKGQEKNQKIYQKKQHQNTEPKFRPEPQQDTQIRPQVPPVAMGYFPNATIPPPQLNGPYNPAYYHGYGVIPPPIQPGVRPPYGMYAPPIHPQAIYPTQPGYQIPNPHMYQIPPPPIPYGSVIQPDIYRLDHPTQMMEPRQTSQQGKSYPFDHQQKNRSAYQQELQNPYNIQGRPSQTYPYKPRQEQNFARDLKPVNQQYRDVSQQQRFEERQRSRDRREFIPSQYENQRPKKFQNNNPTQQHFEQRNSQQRPQNQPQQRRQQGLSHLNASLNQGKSLINEQKAKIKASITESLKDIYSTPEEKEQLLLIIRDVLKYRLLKEQQQGENSDTVGNYVKNKEMIESAYEKALLELQYLVTAHSSADKGPNPSQIFMKKKEALSKILSELQLEDLLPKVKQMRLKKKLIGERKMSEIKKLLEELVKDPRKRIK